MAEENTSLDILGMLQRRLRLIAVTALVVTVGAAVVIALLPDVFEAHSVVFIEPGQIKVSTKDTSTFVPTLGSLIGTLRRAVLSREILRDVVNDLDLYGNRPAAPAGPTATASPRPEGPEGWLERLFYKDPIERAREDININIIKREEQEYVEITARARTPELAARAVNRVADLLAAQNRELRVRRAQDMSAYIEGELRGAQERLQREEVSLKRFRQEHRESLPENELYLKERLRKIEADTEERRRRIDAINIEVKLVGGEIASLLESGRPTAEMAAEFDALEKEIEENKRKDQELAALGYGPRWPERLAAQAKIENLEAKLAELRRGFDAAAAARKPDSREEGAARPRLSPAETERIRADLQRAGSPQAVDACNRLMARVDLLSRDLDRLEREQQQANQETDHLLQQRSKLETTRIDLEKQQQLFEDASKEYRRLLDDQRIVQRFLDLESASQGDQLRTIEAAEVPLVPSAPRRVLLIMIAVLAAIGAGVGLAYLVELTSTTYGTPTALEEDLGVRVLAILPVVADLERALRGAAPRDLDKLASGEPARAPEAALPP